MQRSAGKRAPEVGEDNLFDASASYSYRSRTTNQVGVPAFSQDAYDVLNLSTRYGPADGRWRAGLYVRNALDRRYHAAVIGLPLSRPGGSVNWNTFEGERHAGVTFEMRY